MFLARSNLHVTTRLLRREEHPPRNDIITAMFDLFIPILFWLSIPASLLLSVLGVLRDKYWLVLIGAVLLIPISYYFNGSPSSHGFAIFLPIFQVVSAAAVKEEYKLWAWLFLLPAFSIVLWFIFVVLSYQFAS